MKIIGSGTSYKIFDSSIIVYDTLPVGTYKVSFDKFSGWSLTKVEDIKASNEKLYGVIEEKSDKVLNTFSRRKNNLGVILSGDKGIGKSLFTRVLSVKALSKNIPIILIDSYIPGIANYLSSISQEVMVVFDEFDKTFKAKNEDEDSLKDPQTEMLSLFDGMDSGKKLFIITCNDIYSLSDYLLNRPGRFLYHFRFDYPDAEDIKIYLVDKGITDASQIEKVIEFSRKVKLNYDCLNAIAFELLDGTPFDIAIQDLNIINSGSNEYLLKVYFDTGAVLKFREEELDFFEDEENDMRIYMNDDNATIRFSSNSMVFDKKNDYYLVNKENIHIYNDTGLHWIRDHISYITIKPFYGPRLHYTV